MGAIILTLTGLLVCFFGTSLIRFFSALITVWGILWIAGWMDPDASRLAVLFAALLGMMLSTLLLPFAGFALGVVLFVIAAEMGSALAGWATHPMIFFLAALVGGVVGVFRHRQVARLSTSLVGGWAAAFGLDRLMHQDPSIGSFTHGSLGLWDTHLPLFVVLAAALVLASVGLKVQKRSRETIMRRAASSPIGLDGWGRQQARWLPGH